MKTSYDSELGSQAMESVDTKTRDLDSTCRPTKPKTLTGDAAQSLLQTPYNQLLSKIHNQLDEDKQIVDALESMMKAVHARIVNTDFSAGTK